MSQNVAIRLPALVLMAVMSGCMPSGGTGGRGAADAAPVAADAVVGPAGTGSDRGLEADAQPSFALAPAAVLEARLARLLWDEPELSSEFRQRLQRATSPDDVYAIASAMLEQQQGRKGVAAFFRWWLRLDDLANLPKPEGVLTPALRRSLMQVAQQLAQHVVFELDARYETLMLAPFTFVDETLAKHYELPGIAGPEWRKVSYPSPDRVGLLGGAGVLTRFASDTEPTWPARRFWMINETLLCDTGFDPGQPAVGSVTIDPKKPIRAQMIEVTRDQMCHVCHQFVNPLGFPFLKFDSFGRFRMLDVGGPIDTMSILEPGPYSTESLAFRDQPDLMRQLAARAEVRRCIARRWLEFATQRESPANQATATGPSLDLVSQEFERSGGNLKTLVLEIVRTPKFSGP